MSDLTVRPYRPEDLTGVMALYSSSGMHPPHIVRDRAHFDYLLSHPGVKADGAFVAVAEAGIEGLAIVAIVHKAYSVGKIIELWASGAAAEDALLQRAVEYCVEKKVGSIEVKAPTFLNLDRSPGWCRADWREVLMAKPLSVLPLLRGLCDSRTLERIGAGKGFLLVCGDETIQMDMGEREASIVSRDKGWRAAGDIVVEMSPQTLLQLVFSPVNAYVVYLRGQIKIRGLSNVPRVMKMLRAVRAGRPWTEAMVDRG